MCQALAKRGGKKNSTYSAVLETLKRLVKYTDPFKIEEMPEEAWELVCFLQDTEQNLEG